MHHLPMQVLANKQSPINIREMRDEQGSKQVHEVFCLVSV